MAQLPSLTRETVRYVGTETSFATRSGATMVRIACLPGDVEKQDLRYTEEDNNDERQVRVDNPPKVRGTTAGSKAPPVTCQIKGVGEKLTSSVSSPTLFSQEVVWQHAFGQRKAAKGCAITASPDPWTVVVDDRRDRDVGEVVAIESTSNTYVLATIASITAGSGNTGTLKLEEALPAPAAGTHLRGTRTFALAEKNTSTLVQEYAYTQDTGRQYRTLGCYGGIKFSFGDWSKPFSWSYESQCATYEGPVSTLSGTPISSTAPAADDMGTVMIWNPVLWLGVSGGTHGRATASQSFPVSVVAAISGGSADLPVAVDGAGATTAHFRATQAIITGSGGTLASVTAGHTLNITVNGTPVTVTFAGTESSASTFASTINTAITSAGGQAAASGGQVKISTVGYGSRYSLQITAGSADVLTSLGMSVAAGPNNAGPNDVLDASGVSSTEFATVITGAVSGVTAGADANNHPYIQSSSSGATSSVQVSAGGGATAFGFDALLHAGGADGAIDRSQGSDTRLEKFALEINNEHEVTHNGNNAHGLGGVVTTGGRPVAVKINLTIVNDPAMNVQYVAGQVLSLLLTVDHDGSTFAVQASRLRIVREPKPVALGKYLGTEIELNGYLDTLSTPPGTPTTLQADLARSPVRIALH